MSRRLRRALAALAAAGSFASWCPATLLAADPEPLFTSNPNFRIPFQFDKEEMIRIGAVEVQLHVSLDAGDSWTRVEAVSPQQQKFTFSAPSDGDYWFAVRTIDAEGNSHPGGQLTPGLRVIVDAADPVLTLDLEAVAPGEVQLQWNVVDDHPDATSLRIEYLDDASGAWQPLQVSGATGSTAWNIGSGGTVVVRGTVQDQSGNSTTATSSTQVSAPGSAGRQPAGDQLRPDFREPVASGTESRNGQSAHPLLNTATAGGSLPVILPNMPHGAVPVASGQSVPAQSTFNLRPIAATGAVPAALPATAATPLSQGSQALDQARWVSSRNFRIGYEVNEVGPSGVGSVDLYISEDSGQNWFHYGSDPDQQSPFDVAVPRDGTYGFAIRVRNGIGIVANPPQPGEPAETVVVVDQTIPQLRLTGLQQTAGNGVHQVIVQWFAQDDYLAARPIALYESAAATGPWSQITGWMDNSGQYVWTPNPLDSRTLFVRLEVRDAAGNVNAVVSDRPLLIDGSRPRARIIDVESTPTGANAARPGPLNFE